MWNRGFRGSWPLRTVCDTPNARTRGFIWSREGCTHIPYREEQNLAAVELREWAHIFEKISRVEIEGFRLRGTIVNRTDDAHKNLYSIFRYFYEQWPTLIEAHPPLRYALLIPGTRYVLLGRSNKTSQRTQVEDSYKYPAVRVPRLNTGRKYQDRLHINMKTKRSLHFRPEEYLLPTMDVKSFLDKYGEKCPSNVAVLVYEYYHGGRNANSNAKKNGP